MLTVRLAGHALEHRVAAVRKQLAALGITQVVARLNDGYVSVRARAADGLAAADLSFRMHVVSSGTHLRVLASHVRVLGHLPTPGPVLADRVLTALLGATDDGPSVENRSTGRPSMTTSHRLPRLARARTVTVLSTFVARA